MSPAEFEAFSPSLPAATLTVQWGGSRVYKVGGKMFAVAGPAAAGGWSFKASDAAFEMLAAEGVGRPAPYLARAKWIRFEALDVLPDDETQAYLAAAHALVAARLPRAERRRLGLA